MPKIKTHFQSTVDRRTDSFFLVMSTYTPAHGLSHRFNLKATAALVPGNHGRGTGYQPIITAMSLNFRKPDGLE